jgi:hypothetical protein
MAAAAVNERQASEHLSALVAQRNSRFLERFNKRLDDGCADDILDALRPEVDAAAAKVTETLQLVDASMPDSCLSIEPLVNSSTRRVHYPHISWS